MGCGLWAVQVKCAGKKDLYFRNDTDKDVYIKFNDYYMETNKKDQQLVKAHDSLSVVFGGFKKRSTTRDVAAREFSYAYAIAGANPAQLKTTTDIKLRSQAGLVDPRKDAEFVFAESNEDWAPRAYAVEKMPTAAPAAPTPPMPSYDSGDRKAAAQTQAESEVSRTAGSSSSASQAPGSPKKSTGSTTVSSCH